MAGFIEQISRQFVEATESFQTTCEFENDTDYPVAVDRHDGEFPLPPGESIGQWIYKGFSITLSIQFPNGHSNRISFSSSHYKNETHYISNIFKKEIEEYEKTINKRGESYL